MAETIEVLVDGGKASAGPPLGPALGPTGINIMSVVTEINQKTKDFAGMKVPVKVIIDPKTKSFEITVGTPPASALLKDIAKVQKGSGSSLLEKVADLKIEDIAKVARMKGGDLAGKGVRQRVKEVAGTCVSMGITIEGKDPRDVQKEVDSGLYDDRIKE
ncbi:MAG: 50S ribosomal protein L11 [Euryarchaeota archaeon]|nr:50S ribosomal protein L11 [Euryarchaeota archaeon]